MIGGRKTMFVVGPPSGNCGSRGRGAEACGWRVIWSPPQFTEGMPVWRRFPQFRLRLGPDISAWNRALLRAAVAARPDVVWVELPMFLFPETLERIRRETGTLLVCAYADDPRSPASASRHFDRAVPVYDVIFATKDEFLHRLSEAGCRYPMKFWKGFEPERVRPVLLSGEERKIYGSEVAFVGHSDVVDGRSERKVHLEALARAVPGTRIWGRSWPKAGWPTDLVESMVPRQADGDEYAKVLCGAKIAVQIPSRLNRDTHSSRSVEIPATGTMMLAERTDDHLALFEEDREAVFFFGPEELVEKARFYLKNVSARERIARSGRERCLRSGYSNLDRMRMMLAAVVDLEKR